MPKTYLDIEVKGPLFAKEWKITAPNSNALEDFLSSIAVRQGELFDVTVTVTKSVGGGFNWAVTATGPEGLHESLDITQAASGIASELEGLAVGTGKTFVASARAIEMAS